MERPRLAAVAGAAIRLVPSAVRRLWQRVCGRREVEQRTWTSSKMGLEDAVRLGAAGSDAEQRGAVFSSDHSICRQNSSFDALSKSISTATHANGRKSVPTDPTRPRRVERDRWRPSRSYAATPRLANIGPEKTLNQVTEARRGFANTTHDDRRARPQCTRACTRSPAPGCKIHPCPIARSTKSNSKQNACARRIKRQNVGRCRVPVAHPRAHAAAANSTVAAKSAVSGAYIISAFPAHSLGEGGVRRFSSTPRRPPPRTRPPPRPRRPGTAGTRTRGRSCSTRPR